MRFDQAGLARHRIRSEQRGASDPAKHATRIAPPSEEAEEERAGDAASHHRQQDDTKFHDGFRIREIDRPSTAGHDDRKAERGHSTDPHIVEIVAISREMGSTHQGWIL